MVDASDMRCSCRRRKHIDSATKMAGKGSSDTKMAGRNP
jgi:hypothetical protein